MDTTNARCRRHQRIDCQICRDQAEASSTDTDVMLDTLFYFVVADALTDNDMGTTYDTPDTSSGTSDSDGSDSSTYDSGSSYGSDSGSYDGGSSYDSGSSGGYDGGSSGGFDGGSF